MRADFGRGDLNPDHLNPLEMRFLRSIHRGFQCNVLDVLRSSFEPI